MSVQIKQAQTTDLVLVVPETRFPKGALLTQQAYATYLAFISASEKLRHTAQLIDPAQADTLKLEFFRSLDLH